MSTREAPRRNAGGRGDSVPTIKPVPACLPAGESTPEQAAARYKPTVADVLLRLGVWVTRRDLREAMAEVVEKRGYTAEQLEPLLTHLVAMAGSPGIGCGEVVNLLRDDARLTASLEDWARRRGLTQTSPGEAVRRRDMERLRQLDLEWEKYMHEKAAGLLDPLPTLRKPWER